MISNGYRTVGIYCTVKTPDEEELRIYQAAFIQAMAPIYMVEDDRGKVELPPDPSVNNIFIFGAFADRLVLGCLPYCIVYTILYASVFNFLYDTYSGICRINSLFNIYINFRFE